jgi:aminopeptidase
VTLEPPRELLDALVALAVEFGANVQPGQVVAIDAEVGLASAARAAAHAANARGAVFVVVAYVKRSRLRHADPETLEFVPPWIGGRLLTLGKLHGARIWLYGETEPRLMEDVDPALLGRDILPRTAESMVVVGERQVNWTVVPVATPAWARIVHPELPPADAHARLWETIADVCRLREPDPVCAWRARFATLADVASRLQALELDSLHFTGPGTDLHVGLLAGSRWTTAAMQTEWGLAHHVNLPSEEVFTAPDPRRVEGVVSATRPLLVPGAATVRGLRVRFEEGRAVHFDADAGAEVLRAMAARDDGACRLGEVALVDRESRVARSGQVFSNILLDENAASHIALGNAYPMSVAGEDAQAQINRSSIHVDFMIGSDEVDVTARTRTGAQLPLMRGGAWQI